MMRSCLLAALLSLAHAGVRLQASQSFLQAVEYTQTFRVCNAYAGDEQIQISKDGKDLTGGMPLKYKECRALCPQLVGSLKAGDRLEFVADSLPAASFTVSAMPEHDAIMLIVVHRRDLASDAVTFQSHMFSPSKTAQVAVVNTFLGKTASTLTIADAGSKEEGAKESSALLPFGTSSGLQAGSFQLILRDTKDSKPREVLPFEVAGGECYVVIRTGLDDDAPEQQEGSSLARMMKTTASSFVHKMETDTGSLVSKMESAAGNFIEEVEVASSSLVGKVEAASGTAAGKLVTAAAGSLVSKMEERHATTQVDQSFLQVNEAGRAMGAAYPMEMIVFPDGRATAIDEPTQEPTEPTEKSTEKSSEKSTEKSEEQARSGATAAVPTALALTLLTVALQLL